MTGKNIKRGQNARKPAQTKRTVERDRCIVVSAREEGFGKHENDDEEENFLSSEIAQRVEQSKATSSDKDRNETLEVCDDIDDDARCLLDGRDALEIEPMPLSDCTTHVLLLLRNREIFADGIVAL